MEQITAFQFSCGPIRVHLICTVQTPLHLSFSPEKHAAAIAWLNARHGLVLEAGREAHPFKRLLEDYLKGHRRAFPDCWDSPFIARATEFERRVWEYLRKIPYGETRTYGEVARNLGGAGYARAVGRACGANPLALVVPCHRVVGAAGRLGGFTGGLAVKQALLDLERATRTDPTASS